MPLDLLAPFGAGIQVHVEDLAAYLAGRERRDGEARWNELLPAYRDLAAAARIGAALASQKRAELLELLLLLRRRRRRRTVVSRSDMQRRW